MTAPPGRGGWRVARWISGVAGGPAGPVLGAPRGPPGPRGPVDGAGRGKTVWYVVLPLALPGLIAAAIFTFILAWNDFLFALVLITSDELKTLPVGVQDLFSAAVVDWGLVMAAGMLITIPALAFFMAVQRHLVAGWGTGGLKG